MISDEGYIRRSINKHGYIGNNLNPASISTILKILQEGLKSETNELPLSGHSFRVGAALDLLEQGEADLDMGVSFLHLSEKFPQHLIAKMRLTH